MLHAVVWADQPNCLSALLILLWMGQGQAANVPFLVLEGFYAYMITQLGTKLVVGFSHAVSSEV